MLGSRSSIQMSQYPVTWVGREVAAYEVSMRILITVKTYPIPSAKYDELVCTAGVVESGEFVRLYPINFRDLPYTQQYKKYQWIEVDVKRHEGSDVRKESYRPDCDTLKVIGEPIQTKNGDWSARAGFVLKCRSRSLEDLRTKQEEDRTSLGIFRPKKIDDLLIKSDSPEWKASFKAAMCQARLWDDRSVSKQPPRKVPFKFQYCFTCDDSRCQGHQMMIEDWEVGALFWRLRDKGVSPDEAAKGVREKFLSELCGPKRDTHFYVGTVSAHPTSWVVIGVFYPARSAPSLFDEILKNSPYRELFSL